MANMGANNPSTPALLKPSANAGNRASSPSFGSNFIHSISGSFGAFSRQLRDLSDIRETSGSSKDGIIRRTRSSFLDGRSEKKDVKAGQNSIPDLVAGPRKVSEASVPPHPRETQPVAGSRPPSVLSLPLKDVPERRSSATFLGRDGPSSRRSSMNDLSWKLPPLQVDGKTIPSNGRSRSPVRAAIQQESRSSNTFKRSPSRTFVKTTPPLDILTEGNARHQRVEVNLQTPAPLFVGGGTIEGHILLTVDGGNVRRGESKPVNISKLSVDVIGVEESDERRWIFLSLATELFDREHPPPDALVSSRNPLPGSELLWPLRPSSVIVPFCLNLPLNIGPPPYISKHARIRYTLCATATVKPADKLSIARHSFEVQMLTVFDPEKALSSLPHPLLAMEQLSISHGLTKQHVKLTAGLHRQTWVHGAKIFVDVHIVNNTSRTVKKIEVRLEKTTLWYPYAAAGTLEKSAAHLRLPKRTDHEHVCSFVVKKGKEWKGVPARTNEVRTCGLDVPQGHVTVGAGRFFEVRYFLNIEATVTMFKSVAVQLPVTIIHINSLDIVPNALTQVAASIEAKRARTLPVSDTAIYPSFQQGQAFSAPRRQSLERSRRSSAAGNLDEMAAIAKELENSPRRYARASTQIPGNQSLSTEQVENVHTNRYSTTSSHHHLTRHDSCYHCHLEDADQPPESRRPSASSSVIGPKLPRLQLSTSGLGFSESEFEIAPDFPLKKVMLSESERNLIEQQRELKIQRQLSERERENPDLSRHPSRRQKPFMNKENPGQGPGGYWGWRNVAIQPMTTPNHHKAFPDGGFPASAGPLRPRSNTGPGRGGIPRSGPSLPKLMPLGPNPGGQMPRRTRGSMNRGGGGRRASMERVRSHGYPGGMGMGMGGGMGMGKGQRASVDRW